MPVLNKFIIALIKILRNKKIKLRTTLINKLNLINKLMINYKMLYNNMQDLDGKLIEIKELHDL
jgi:hypothetical protein